MKLTVIGVDPGPSTGIVKLYWDDKTVCPLEIVQCNALSAPSVVDALIRRAVHPVYIAIEKFVDGRRSGRGNAPGAAKVTRDLITNLTIEYSGKQPHMLLIFRSASEVKPWANDERLHRVGLWTATKGMTHARDAARHALFAAVKLGVPDPLSTRGVVPT